MSEKRPDFRAKTKQTEGREMHIDLSESKRANWWLYAAFFGAMATFIVVSALAPVNTQAMVETTAETPVIQVVQEQKWQLDPKIQAALDASYFLESSCGENLKGDKGKSVGPLHVQKQAVDDVNRILGRKEFKYSDRMSLEKSGMIFYVYLIHYGKAYEKTTGKMLTTETYVRIWNGGPDGWKEKATAKHWQKAKTYLAKAG